MSSRGHRGRPGQTFDTPSAAASTLALTKDGQTTSLNGWNSWEARLPDAVERKLIKNPAASVGSPIQETDLKDIGGPM
jgi:hypothetical protein